MEISENEDNWTSPSTEEEFLTEEDSLVQIITATESSVPMYEQWASETIPIPEVKCAIPMYEQWSPKKIINRKSRDPEKDETLKKSQSSEARAIMEEVFNTESGNSEDVNRPPINGWDKKTEGTIKKWQRDISKSSFIYGEELEHNNKRIQTALVTTVITGSLMTITAAILITLNTYNESLVPKFILEGLMLIGGGIVTTVNGFIKIFGWDSKVKELVKFIERLDSQWFVFETQMSIPPEQRQLAREFIKRIEGDYMHLMQECPYISVADYIAANQSYQTQLSENFVWQQKFNNRLEKLV